MDGKPKPNATRPTISKTNGNIANVGRNFKRFSKNYSLMVEKLLFFFFLSQFSSFGQNCSFAVFGEKTFGFGRSIRRIQETLQSMVNLKKDIIILEAAENLFFFNDFF